MQKNDKLSVALLFGGVGSERQISQISAYSIAKTLKSICNLYSIGIATDGCFYLWDGDESAMKNGSWENEKDHLYPISFVHTAAGRGLLFKDKLIPIDVVLPALHGDFGEDGRIQGLLDTVGIPYVGANTLSGALCADKSLTKIVAEHLCIPTLPWCTLSGTCAFAEAKLQLQAIFSHAPYPIILKPLNLGSSIGIYVVENDTQLRRALSSCRVFGEMIAERFLPGVRECEVCYLGVDDGYYFPAEVNIPSADNTPYTYEKKYKTNAPPVSGEPLSDALSRALIRYARTLVRTLSLRDLARLDFFVSHDGQIYFNEINTFPGFSEQSFYPQVLKMNGFDYKTLLLSLLEAAYDRGIR